MPKAVRYDRYGGIEVLYVAEVERPAPGPGQVLVAVRAAGINPGEAKIRDGLMHSRWPATFPSGQGSDFAGVVEETGEGVTGFSRGDEVIGWTDDRASQAEYIDTIADFSAPAKYGVKAEGTAAAADAGVLAELAAMIDRGELEIPIAHVYPLAQVQEAYRELEKGHTRGKIVLVP